MPPSGLMSLQLKFYKICIHCQLSINALSSTDVKSFDVIPLERSKCWIAIAPSGCSYSEVGFLCSFLLESLFLQGTSVGSSSILWQQFWHSASQYLLGRTMHVWLDHHPLHSYVFGHFGCFHCLGLVGSTLPCLGVPSPWFPTFGLFRLCRNVLHTCRGSCRQRWCSFRLEGFLHCWIGL